MSSKLAPALLIVSLLFACGENEEAEAPVSTDPIVGAMEIPISLRNDAAELANATLVEVSPRELRLDHRKILDLESGRLPEGAASGNIIEALRAALAEGENRPAVMRIYFSTPFATFSRIIYTLQEAGREEMSIEVRSGQGPEKGYLRARFRAAPASEEPVEFDASDQLPWDAVRSAWGSMREACEHAESTDCDGTPANIAEGGKAELRLWARGRAVRVHVEQFDAPEPEPEAAGGPQLIEGIAPPTEANAEPPPPPPSTDATFTWRFQATVQNPSPVSGTVGALCSSRRCGVLLTGEEGTSYGSLISLLGAAFPNGRPAPMVHVVIPNPR